VGFGSAEAFTHAFNSRFDCSPTSWRLQQTAARLEESNFDQALSKADQVLHDQLGQNGGPSSSTAETRMKVEIIDRQPTPILYLRYVGPYGSPIGAFWQTQVYPWMVTNGLIGQARFGISHDDPSVTAAARCRYDGGCEIPDNLVAAGNAHRTVIPGGKYAALSFKGTVAEFEPAWIALLRDWLPSSGLQLDSRPMFEYYPVDARYDPATGALECKLCVPVMPL
jgi:AraC family transcriptional regulator